MTNTIAPPTLEELNKIIDRYESLAHNTHPEFKRKQDVKLYCLRAIRDQKEILK